MHKLVKNLDHRELLIIDKLIGGWERLEGPRNWISLLCRHNNRLKQFKYIQLKIIPTPIDDHLEIDQFFVSLMRAHRNSLIMSVFSFLFPIFIQILKICQTLFHKDHTKFNSHSKRRI